MLINSYAEGVEFKPPSNMILSYTIQSLHLVEAGMQMDKVSLKLIALFIPRKKKGKFVLYSEHSTHIQLLISQTRRVKRLCLSKATNENKNVASY